MGQGFQADEGATSSPCKHSALAVKTPGCSQHCHTLLSHIGVIHGISDPSRSLLLSKPPPTQVPLPKVSHITSELETDHSPSCNLNRPRILSAKPGEILLCESVDRLSRLSLEDWETLKATIKAKGLKLVIADLPTSHQMFDAKGITGEVMRVINDMLIELMSTMARLDQEKRVERIMQGLRNKKAANPDWKPAGKGKDTAKWAKVKETLAKHPTMSADDIAKVAGCGVATVYRIKREMA
ncbi:hypothetical protein CCL12_15080 [Pseudomonas syringae]|nr:hypothetical protein CCL12_15080 [Pseudomonas syringae]